MPKRLAITAPHTVEVIEYEERDPGPKEVLVETELASGKHGTTKAMFDNVNWRDASMDDDMRIWVERAEGEEGLRGGVDEPWPTGTTGVGTIAAAGENVTRWQVGDRVFGFMDIRETNICAEDALWDLGNIGPELALCVEPAYVSFHCIRESNVRFGERVAVIGLGALGLLAVRIADAAGAETIIAVDPLPGRRQWATDNGADVALDPAAGDAAVTIHELTDGDGVDIAIELAGAYAALQTAIRAVRVGGTVCSAGYYQGEAHDLWLGREWHHNRLTMIVPHGCGWGHQPRDYPAWDENRAYNCIVSMMRKGKLAAPGLITPIVPIERAPDVWRLIEQQPNEVIKYGVEF